MTRLWPIVVGTAATGAICFSACFTLGDNYCVGEACGDGGEAPSAGGAAGQGGTAQTQGGHGGEGGSASPTCPCAADTATETKADGETNCACPGDPGACLDAPWLIRLLGDGDVQLSDLAADAEAVYAVGTFTGSLTIHSGGGGGIGFTKPAQGTELFVAKVGHDGAPDWVWRFGATPDCDGNCPTCPAADFSCVETAKVESAVSLALELGDSGIATRIVVAGSFAGQSKFCTATGASQLAQNSDLFALRLSQEGCLGELDTFRNTGRDRVSDVLVTTQGASPRVFITGDLAGAVGQGLGSCPSALFESDCYENADMDTLCRRDGYIAELWAPTEPALCAQIGLGNHAHNDVRAMSLSGTTLWFAGQYAHNDDFPGDLSYSYRCGPPQTLYTGAKAVDIMVAGIDLNHPANVVAKARLTDVGEELQQTVRDVFTHGGAVYVVGSTEAQLKQIEGHRQFDPIFDSVGASAYVGRFDSALKLDWGLQLRGVGADAGHALGWHDELGLLAGGLLTSQGDFPQGLAPGDTAGDGFVYAFCGGDVDSVTTGLLVGGEGDQTVNSLAAADVAGGGVFIGGVTTTAVQFGVQKEGADLATPGAGGAGGAEPIPRHKELRGQSPDGHGTHSLANGLWRGSQRTAFLRA